MVPLYFTVFTAFFRSAYFGEPYLCNGRTRLRLLLTFQQSSSEASIVQVSLLDFHHHQLSMCQGLNLSLRHSLLYSGPHSYLETNEDPRYHSSCTPIKGAPLVSDRPESGES